MLLNKTQIKTLLTMQDDLNKIIDIHWHSKQHDYMRAIAVEAIEGIEHHGWKWWKFQQVDLSQLQMEMIDIFHFYLSQILQMESDNYLEKAIDKANSTYINEWNNSEKIVFDGQEYDLNDLSLLQKLDLLCGLACSKKLNFNLFFNICKNIELQPQDIYERYVQKNTLNIFRQINGYKQGTYKKIWLNQEDNIHLMEIAKTLDSTSESYAKSLYLKLTEKYCLATIPG